MQVNVLPASHPGAMTMMSFPEIPQAAREWVNNQLSATTGMLSDIGRGFLTRAMDLHRAYNDGSIEQAARKVMRSVKSLMHPNMICPLKTVSDIRAAKPVMQRYIMAQPNIRALYHRQLCDGYSDSYIDLQPGVIGEEHYDYRRVMEHVVQVVPGEKEGDEERIMIQHFIEDLDPNDRKLDVAEQHIILDIWEMLDNAIANRDDPTDIFGGQLGG